MSIFSNLRLLVLLRRIARALESLAISNKVLADLASERSARRERHKKFRKPVPAELGTMDVVEVERRWTERQKVENLDRG